MPTPADRAVPQPGSCARHPENPGDLRYSPPVSKTATDGLRDDCNSTHLRFAPLQWPGSHEELAGPSSIGHRRLPAGGPLRDWQARKDSVSYRGMRCHKTPPVNGPFRGRGSEIYCVYNSYPRQRQFGYRLSRNGSRLQTLKSSIKLVLIFK